MRKFYNETAAAAARGKTKDSAGDFTA